MARAPRSKFSVPAQNNPAPVPDTPVVAAVQVNWERPELERIKPQYQLIDDCIAGSIAVKARGDKYLPRPEPEDNSVANNARYEGYKARAVFYNVAQHTLNGFVGSVFDIDPIIQLPEVLKAIEKDADGSGVSLVQQAKVAEKAVLSKGRAGLLIDFPKTDRVTTRAELLDGTVRPTIILYQPHQIINWRTTRVGNKSILSLVVLAETYEAHDDGFAVELMPQFRVLRLVDGRYVQELWKVKGGVMPQAATEVIPQLGANGQPLNEIPFTFIGAEDNSPSVDDAPMFALCDLNIAHYRNSADYEESVYVTGQATPVVSGLTANWYQEIMKEVIRFGSRAGIPLPEGATADLLQMEERTAGFAAMEHKEKQMVALGAKLVETKQVQRTATETSADNASAKSVLRTVTDNVSAAYQFALEWAAIFVGVTTVKADANKDADDKDAIKFELNTDFDIATVSNEEANAAINAWLKEAISFTEMRLVLKQSKLAHQEDKKAQKEIQDMRMESGLTDAEGNPLPPTPPVVGAGNAE